MIYYLSQYLLKISADTEWDESLSFLRLFRYITFRSGGAAITALLLSWWLGPKVIAWLKRVKFGQDYQDKAAETGLLTRGAAKMGTPTMGGILIVPVMDFTALLWAQWNTLMLLTLLSVVVLAGLGFYDDFAKITQQSNKGAAANAKLWVQSALALFIALYLWRMPATSKLISEVMVPFHKYPVAVGTAGVVLGLLLTAFAIVGSSNAVNLTDGLDTIFCAAMVGAGLGFLWFNCHPALVFMGDTGSLALGGALGIIAVLIHQPLVLLIAGGVFVAEAVSVMAQRAYFKYTKKRYGEGRRIFLMAPLHHHFEKKGWHESQVVMRFYILCILCGLVALSTLKIR